ncbi:MAG: hypothetical protein HY719_16260, partial [Planctomycetes bacterium]|nr:hypothetical protein [Planctomycetota bacterium]
MRRHSRVAFAALATALTASLAPTPAAAQEPPAPDNDEGDLLAALTRLGPREAGSRAQLEASHLVARRLAAAGYALEEEAFAFLRHIRRPEPGFDGAGARLFLAETDAAGPPAAGTEFPAELLPYSGLQPRPFDTSAALVSGEVAGDALFLRVGSAAEYRGRDASGHFVIVYRTDYTLAKRRSVFDTRGASSPSLAEQYRAAVDAGAAALIVVSEGTEHLQAGAVRNASLGIGPIPALSVSGATGRNLIKRLFLANPEIAARWKREVTDPEAAAGPNPPRDLAARLLKQRETVYGACASMLADLPAPPAER